MNVDKLSRINHMVLRFIGILGVILVALEKFGIIPHSALLPGILRPILGIVFLTLVVISYRKEEKASNDKQDPES